MLHSFCEFVCPFSLFPLKGGYLCILVASYGHVSLTIDQLDWQRCQSPCGTVESLQDLKTDIEHIVI